MMLFEERTSKDRSSLREDAEVFWEDYGDEDEDEDYPDVYQEISYALRDFKKRD